MSPVYRPIPIATTKVRTSDDTVAGTVEASYSAHLYETLVDSIAPLKLSISLAIRLEPLGTIIPVAADADGTLFYTAPWSAAGWGMFLYQAQSQALMWNNKFWLVPPQSFDGYDRTIQGYPKRFRPNVYCELVVDWASEDPDRTIEVANLDLSKLPADTTLDPGTFRSHATLYDSLDGVPWAFPYGTGPGSPAQHFVIAHELGHALGLDHIGVLRRVPVCEIAIGTQGIGDFWGGTNALVCYGYNQGLVLAGNIMGAGSAFSEELGQPWVTAMQYITTQQSYILPWRVVMRDPGPGTWVDFKARPR